MTEEPVVRRRGRPTNASKAAAAEAATAGIGHNEPPVDDVTEDMQTIAAGQLRAFIERVERLTEEKKTIADDIKEVFAEMKGTGFDTKAVRVIIRLRNMDQAARQEAEAIVDLYKNALGMN